MHHIFAQYPELILFDATYKLNNRDMPLFTQCVVDGDGHTEIASLFICRSESREGIGGFQKIQQRLGQNRSHNRRQGFRRQVCLHRKISTSCPSNLSVSRSHNIPSWNNNAKARYISIATTRSFRGIATTRIFTKWWCIWLGIQRTVRFEVRPCN